MIRVTYDLNCNMNLVNLFWEFFGGAIKSRHFLNLTNLRWPRCSADGDGDGEVLVMMTLMGSPAEG